jgi:phosphatidate cytidylyltransferase
MSNSLRSRIGTALVLAVVILSVLLLLPAVVAVAIILLMFLAGAWEWAGLAGRGDGAARLPYVLAIAGAVGLAWMAAGSNENLRLLLLLAAAWWTVATVLLLSHSRQGGWPLAFIAGFFVLVPAAVGLCRLVQIEPAGRQLLLYLIVLVAAADVGAYFGGRAFGRHKLAPMVSPGKTWEGFAAGMLAAVAAAWGGARYFDVPVAPWLALSMVVAVASVVGDLIESLFKRRAGLKDSGSMLPGHGGMLDRIDSITAAGPLFLLGLLMLDLYP